MFTVQGRERNRRIRESAFAEATADRWANRRGRGFTLLEIMLAVGILGLMSLAIFRFVQANMTALRLSSDIAGRDSQYDGLRDLLTTEWQSVGPISSKMYGEPLKVNDQERDWVRWSCSAGPGLLTRYAPGDFTVTLGLKPESEKSDRLDLGFLRKPKDDSGVGEGHETWVPLIKNVSTLQISYFNPNLNTWIDRWSDMSHTPWLVKVTVGRSDSAVPWEAIIPLKRTPY